MAEDVPRHGNKVPAGGQAVPSHSAQAWCTPNPAIPSEGRAGEPWDPRCLALPHGRPGSPRAPLTMSTESPSSLAGHSHASWFQGRAWALFKKEAAPMGPSGNGQRHRCLHPGVIL